jgi:hypothetical protein
MSRVMSILVVLGLAGAVAAAAAPEDERWQVESARGSVSFLMDLIPGLGIQVTPLGPADWSGRRGVAVQAAGHIELLAPGSRFRDVGEGELRLDSRGVINFNGTELALRDLRVRRGTEERTLAIFAPDGRPLFECDYMHFEVDREARSIHMYNMDMRMTEDTARLLGEQRFAGMAIGVLELTAPLNIPAGAVETPDSCTNPDWGAPDNDVAITNLGSMQQVARLGTFPTGSIGVAPSASLQNVGTHEVPWYTKFSGSFPPYSNDQHPFLVWNMYRIANGAVEQIGVSPLKHAFLTINSGCSCSNSHILGVGCSDTYAVSNNDSSGDVGIRPEVTAHTGIWKRCGSIFDVNCDGIPNSTPRTTTMERRMAVLESDLQTPGAVYYLDGWYVIRDDVNIFNTMGWRSFTATGGTTWSFNFTTSLTPGSVIDQWVNPTTPGPNAQSVAMDTKLGHMRLAVKATDLGGGQWHYEYALQNFDFDPQVKSFSLPLPGGVTPTNIGFHDADQNAATDWTASVAGNAITWTAPSGAASQDFSTLVNFRFDANAAPTGAGGVAVSLGFQAVRGVLDWTPLTILGPGTATSPGVLVSAKR